MNNELLINMRPIFDKNYVESELFNVLLKEVPWVNVDAPRDECFMAEESLEYTYGKGFTRTYKSIELHPAVKSLMYKLNADFNCNYNVCFLNFYKSDKEHLGWHADDSPEMNAKHPIAVISFGAERSIWIKNKDYKGNIPDEDKFNLPNGSLFIMPAGFQANHLHKIPKNDKPCGGRISLTFRNYLSPTNINDHENK